MSARQKAEISRVQRAEAKFIREGGLGIDWFSDRETPKVHQSSWELLAVINERGILTYGSQDAINSNTGEINDYERSYVQACMLDNDDTYKIVERFNLWSDSMIAFVCARVTEAESSKNWRSKIPVSLRFHEDRGGWYASISMGPPIDPRWNKEMRWLFGLTKRLPIVDVIFIDAEWGRPATADDGLFNAVLQALDPSIIHPRNSRHPPRVVPVTRMSEEVIAENRATWEGPPSSLGRRRTRPSKSTSPRSTR